MKNIKIFLILFLIFLFLLNNGVAEDNEQFNISIGIKIHGHIEPILSFSFNLNDFKLTLKTGIIYDDGTFILVPGMFIVYKMENFQPYTGLEGFFPLGFEKNLFLLRIGGLYYFPINNFSLGIGGEIGIPLNYNFKIIPTLILNLEF